MGLFITENKHHMIYKNHHVKRAPNQAVFKRSHSDDLLETQLKQHNQLQQSILKLSILSKQQDSRQMSKWQDVSRQLSYLQDRGHKHEIVENNLAMELASLIKENKKLQDRIDKETSSNQEIVKQIEQIKRSNKGILEQIRQQEIVDQNLFIRLENQEAVSEKLVRQIDNLRSVLYERTNFLTEKIEEGFKLTSVYLYQLLTRSDQSLTLSLPKQKEK